jgi:adenylate cyclase
MLQETGSEPRSTSALKIADIQAGSRLRVGDWTVEPGTNRLRRGEEVVHLEPKVMKTLLYLAMRPGEVVPRRELETGVWEGAIVGYDTVTGAIQKIRKALGDDRRHTRVVETISKSGYRLIAPVTVGSVELPGRGVSAAPGAPARGPWLQRSLARASLGVTILATAFAAGWSIERFGHRSMSPTEPSQHWSEVGDRPSLLVQPLANRSGDPSERYVSDGLTADLRTELSKIPGLAVVPNAASIVSAADTGEIAEIGSRLGVRYILRGSLRSEGERLRVDVELVDTTMRDRLWTESFQGNVADGFGWRNAIIDKTRSALTSRVGTIDRLSYARHHIPKADAYDLYLRGTTALFRLSLENLLAARAFFEEAVHRDPLFARAYAALANTYCLEVSQWWSGDPQASLRQARALAAQAATLDSALPEAHYALASVGIEMGHLDRATEEAKKVTALDPATGDGHVLLASILTYSGRPTESLGEYGRALDLNLPRTAHYLFHRGQTYYTLGDYSEAIRLLEAGIEQEPDAPRVRVWLAAAYGQVGRAKDAEWLVKGLRTAHPEISVSRIAASVPYRKKSDRDRLVEGLRKAGLPE